MSTDLAALLRQLRRRGYVTRLTRSGHWQIYRHGRLAATTSSTPSDHRSLRNLRATLKKRQP